MTDTLIQRLSDEADLCRNDGATDVAKLIDDAVFELVRQMNNVKWMKLRVEQQAAQIEAESHTVEPLRRLWPLIERSVKGYVFTSDKAGEVAADMAALRKAIES